MCINFTADLEFRTVGLLLMIIDGESVTGRGVLILNSSSVLSAYNSLSNTMPDKCKYFLNLEQSRKTKQASI